MTGGTNFRDACTGVNPNHDDCGADDPKVCACPCHGWYGELAAAIVAAAAQRSQP